MTREITAPERIPLATDTELGSGTGDGSGCGGGGPGGGGGGNDFPGPGEGGGPGQSAGGLGINLEAVVQATVSDSFIAAMAMEADIMRIAVEARLAAEKTGVDCLRLSSHTSDKSAVL